MTKVILRKIAKRGGQLKQEMAHTKAHEVCEVLTL
jgi:hypothetical protein